MSLIRRLFGGPNFKKHADTFTLTRDVVRRQLGPWVRLCLEKNQQVMVLAHFPSTFDENVASLEHARVDYEIISQPILADQLKSIQEHPAPSVWLTMPEMLLESNRPDELSPGQYETAIIVTERHPLVQHDEKIEGFARQIGGKVELGYFLSLEDPVMRYVVNRRTIELLKQLGLGRNDLISSHMTSRVLERMLRRVADQVSEEQPASSPEEWLELNLSK